MVKKSLLELVQSILNDIDGDEVNSIQDTTLSMQVAYTIKSCFEELITNRNWPHQKRIMKLESSNNTQLPNYLRIPEDVKELIQFKYNRANLVNTKIQYQDVKFIYPDEFLDMIYTRDSSNENIDTITDPNGVSLLIYNNKAPDYWTTFNDVDIVCDSYDKTVDTTLQSSKTQITAYKQLSFEIDDDFIPDIPAEAFALLENESKSVCFLNYKQMANQKAEQKAARQQRWLARKAWKAHGGIRYENYGRK